MPTLDFFWGFDVVRSDSGWIDTSAHYPPVSITGRFGGLAARFGGDVGAGAQQKLAHGLANPTTGAIGFAYRQYEVPGTTAGVDIFHITRSSGTRAVTLRTRADKKLDIYRGEPPIFDGTTVSTLSDGGWYYIEVKFDSGSGELTVLVNNVIEWDSPNFPLFTPNSFDFNWDGNIGIGFDIDDLYQASDTGISPGAAIGPCRVTAAAISGDSSVQWAASPAGSHFSKLTEHAVTVPGSYTAPDGDATIVLANSAGLRDVYNLAGISCFALIIAVAENAICRRVGGNGRLDLLYRMNGALSDVITNGQELSSTYALGQGITTDTVLPGQQVFQGNPWNDQQVSQAKWGFASHASIGGFGPVDGRVTTFWVEKLTTLTGLPFRCGQGVRSYAA